MSGAEPTAPALLDWGNSRCKLLLPAAALRVCQPDQLPRYLAPGDRVVVCASVPDAGARLDRLLPDVAVELLGRDLSLPDCGQYPGCGSDRVLAGLAAGPGVVVQAGTATTVDGWVAGPADAPPRFLGGLILPGERACLQGLHQAAPGLPLVEPGESAPQPLARATTEAIANGLAIGYPALVERCIAAVAAAAGSSRLVITGGAGAALAERLSVGLATSLQPDLVLRGLARLVGVDADGMPSTTE